MPLYCGQRRCFWAGKKDSSELEKSLKKVIESRYKFLGNQISSLEKNMGIKISNLEKNMDISHNSMKESIDRLEKSTDKLIWAALASYGTIMLAIGGLYFKKP